MADLPETLFPRRYIGNLFWNAPPFSRSGILETCLEYTSLFPEQYLGNLFGIHLPFPRAVSWKPVWNTPLLFSRRFSDSRFRMVFQSCTSDLFRKKQSGFRPPFQDGFPELRTRPLQERAVGFPTTVSGWFSRVVHPTSSGKKTVGFPTTVSERFSRVAHPTSSGKSSRVSDNRFRTVFQRTDKASVCVYRGVSTLRKTDSCRAFSKGVLIFFEKNLQGPKKCLTLQSTNDGAVAQMVEQWTENPCVGSSILPSTT